MPGAKIARVDNLECLRNILGDRCLTARSTLYGIISGLTDERAWCEQLANWYKNYPEAIVYVNNVFEHGDSAIPIGVQVSGRLRDEINKYSEDVMQQFVGAGGKYLVTTHLYTYFKFAPTATIPDVKGVKIIC